MSQQPPDDWRQALISDISSDYFAVLQQFIAVERSNFEVFPVESDVFNALRLTPLNTVRVVILGQDPYHDFGQAHGLSFSVRKGVKQPPSLVNIMRELATDVGCSVPRTGCLTPWAKQGVLLLNAVLTVRAHRPNSHRNRGWEQFTDSIIRTVNDMPASTVFVLWGAAAHRKSSLLDLERHTVIASPHPSPLSAHAGFFGSKPFSRVNDALIAHGLAPIDWRLPDADEDSN